MEKEWFNVTFIYRSHGAKDVYLAGDFCSWNITSHRMNPCTEGFSVTLLLGEGYYEYKFYVDGHWVVDEHNPHRERTYGNSIMFVHMDPGVYGLRDQHPPHRDHGRAQGDSFQVICPKVPESLSSQGVWTRLVFVYLPPSYNDGSERHYPVMYIHDGQNVFSTPGYHGGPMLGGLYLDEKLDYFWGQGLPEFIVVAIPNSDFVCCGNRKREYCPDVLSNTAQHPFVRYIIDVVKTEVDNSFRTLPNAANTYTYGASTGGVISFCMAMYCPDKFSCAISISPSFWFVDKMGATCFDVVRNFNKQKPSCRLYIDSGDGIGDNMFYTREMALLLEEEGWKDGEDFLYYLDKCSDQRDNGETHTEAVWKERLHVGLNFAFKRDTIN